MVLGFFLAYEVDVVLGLVLRVNGSEGFFADCEAVLQLRKVGLCVVDYEFVFAIIFWCELYEIFVLKHLEAYFGHCGQAIEHFGGFFEV